MIAYTIEIQKSKFANIYFRDLVQSEPGLLNLIWCLFSSLRVVSFILLFIIISYMDGQ